MPVRTLIVTATADGHLDVEETAHANDFCKCNEPYDIQFVLTGPGLGGAVFCQGTSPPAFEWIDQPLPQVFPMWTPIDKKRKVRLVNVNFYPEASGAWRYRLSVMRGEKLLQTTLSNRPLDIPDDVCGKPMPDKDLMYSRTVDNPIIINR